MTTDDSLTNLSLSFYRILMSFQFGVGLYRCIYLGSLNNSFDCYRTLEYSAVFLGRDSAKRSRGSAYFTSGLSATLKVDSGFKFVAAISYRISVLSWFLNVVRCFTTNVRHPIFWNAKRAESARNEWIIVQQYISINNYCQVDISSRTFSAFYISN